MIDLVLRKAAGKVGRCGIDGDPADHVQPRVAPISSKSGAVLDGDTSARPDSKSVAKTLRRNGNGRTVGQNNVTLGMNG